MNYSKESIIFIHILWIGCISVADGSCDYNFKGFDLNQAVRPRPGKINITLMMDPFSNSHSRVLLVVDKKIHQNFNLTLLAIPYKNDKSECPRTISIKDNIRQYNETCTFIKRINKRTKIFFANIFTGCYYCIMTNEESNNTWQLGPVFINTSYNYHDINLELLSEKNKPEDSNSSRQVTAFVKIRLKCVEVRAQFFQFQGEVDAADDIRDYKIHESQDYWFRMGEKNVIENYRKESKLTTSLILDVDVYENKGEEWTAKITWKELQHGNGTYYLRFAPYTKYCDKLYDPDDAEKLYTWRAMNRSIFIPLGFLNATNDAKNSQTGIDSVIIITIIVGISLMITTLIAILMFRKLKLVKTYVLTRRAPGKECEQLSEKSPQQNLKEFRNILLMYVRDSPPFMELIRNFRNDLKNTCNCQVYDLYGDKEFDTVRQLGPIEWIEQLLREGCKVVWLDTPEFRARLNNPQERYAAKDFRDDAIPHAVHLIKEIFRNSTTQYLYHFVVRVEGFEVEDDMNDPLLVVVPHERYYIPEQLSLLCKNLTESSNKIVGTTECEA